MRLRPANVPLLPFFAAGAGLIWMMFAYQYGFAISPDGWFRGVLAKSILAGTPYFIGFKQGYAYDYGPWHHDASHEPFLPVMLAISSLLFGSNISTLNIISTFSAGFLLWPLTVFSRIAFKSAAVGLLGYLLIVITRNTDYTYEIFAGLSFPSALVMLFGYLALSARADGTLKRYEIISGGVLLALYYLARGEACLVICLLVPGQYYAARKLLPSSAVLSLKKMWLIAGALVLPWFLRKLITFGNPFFSHMSPLLWADHGAEYWTYREDGTFPSAQDYFATHTVGAFLKKLFYIGPARDYLSLEGIFGVWAPIIIAAAAVFAARQFWPGADRQRRFAILSLAIAGFGSMAVLMQVPVQDRRVLLVISFSLVLLSLGLLFEMFERLVEISAKRAALIGSAVILLIIAVLHRDAFYTFRRDYLHFSYDTADQRVRMDTTAKALRSVILDDGAILAPFANTQYLHYVSGLPLVEIPANYRQMKDPAAFFRRFNIRYALVDPVPPLDRALADNWQSVGTELLFKLNDGRSGVTAAEVQDDLTDPSIARSIAQAKIEKRIYLPDQSSAQHFRQWLEGMGFQVYSAEGSVTASRRELFNSGLIIASYEAKKRLLAPTDRTAIRRFLQNGGSVLVAGHAWLWTTGEGQTLEQFPLNEFIHPLGCILLPNALYKIAPETSAPKELLFDINPDSSFSQVLCRNSIDTLANNQDGISVAVSGSTKAGGRFMIWGHDEPLLSDRWEKPASQAQMKSVLNALLEPAAQ